MIMNEYYLVELEMGSVLAGIHCTNFEKEPGIHLLAAYQNVEQILPKKKLSHVYEMAFQSQVLLILFYNGCYMVHALINGQI